MSDTPLAFDYSIDDLGEAKMCLRLRGILNEDVNLGLILDVIAEVRGAYKVLFLDLSRLMAINSCGVREWILFIEKLQHLVNCQFSGMSQIFVEQANSVANMIGRPPLPVTAFEAPYFCEKCDLQTSKTLTRSMVRESAGTFVAPQFNCEKCQEPLVFDSFEEEYFNFLKLIK